MATGNNPEEKPVGERLRDLINPALEDLRKKEIQLGILDEFFANMAQNLPKMMENNLRNIFNKVSYMDSEERNEFIIEQLTRVDGQGSPLYSPSLPFNVKITTAYTDFAPMDIKELPGYIKLHEAARAADVAIGLKYLFADEVKIFEGMGPPPRLTIDGGKSYVQGAMENQHIYPNLPDPPAPKTDPKGPPDFNI